MYKNVVVQKITYERGVLKTALWLIEEIGELARAIVRDGNYEEELVDIVAWTYWAF